MSLGSIEHFISEKAKKGDIEAVREAQRLRARFGDEFLPDTNGTIKTQDRVGLREFTIVDRPRGHRLAVVTEGIEYHLLPSEMRFLHPLVRNIGDWVEERVIRLSIGGGVLYASRGNLSVVYGRVREKMEPDLANPRHLLHTTLGHFRLTGFEPNIFLSFVREQPQIFTKQRAQ